MGTAIDIDEAACAEIMRRYGFVTRQEAINYALRALAAQTLDLEVARAMKGSGWDADLDQLRS